MGSRVRQAPMHYPQPFHHSNPIRPWRPLALGLLIAATIAAGCVAIDQSGRPTSSAEPTPRVELPCCTPPTPTDDPSPSPPLPSTDPSPSATTPVASPARAAALVLASDPRFAGIGPMRRGVIGQSSWYQAQETSEGFAVAVRIGWGDCPSGCIDEHRWRYSVTRDGAVSLDGESGEPVPPGTVQEPAEGDGELKITIVAGPTCGVETVPPRPGCADRPVPGATVVVRDAQGASVAAPVSDEEGVITLSLPAGVYVLEPADSDDFPSGQVEPSLVWVTAGQTSLVTVAYDTGIR